MTTSTGTANLNFARELIEHCCWEDARVWQLAIAPLTEAQFVQPAPFGLGSIQRECAHVMAIERRTLQRVRGESTPARHISQAEPDRAAMRRQWRAIHADWTAFMSELDSELFFSERAFHEGERDRKLKVWQLIFDVIYQGTAHRSDILRMVAEVQGAPQFDLSLMQYLSGVYRK